MKFDVTFAEGGIAQSGLMGPGAVYLDETGVVMEGDIPRFTLPFLAQFFRQIICARGTRTIPFSRIEEYRAPTMIKRVHKIVYRLPDRRQRTIVFAMKKKERKRNDAEFSTRFHEYRTAMKQFLKDRG